jgi:hypothetical protein
MTEMVLLEYDIVDGDIRETHRWLMPDNTTIGEIIEYVDNSPTVDRESVRIFSAGEW